MEQQQITVLGLLLIALICLFAAVIIAYQDSATRNMCRRLLYYYEVKKPQLTRVTIVRTKADGEVSRSTYYYESMKLKGENQHG